MIIRYGWMQCIHLSFCCCFWSLKFEVDTWLNPNWISNHALLWTSENTSWSYNCLSPLLKSDHISCFYWKECTFEFIISSALHRGTIPLLLPWFMFFANLYLWACMECECRLWMTWISESAIKDLRESRALINCGEEAWLWVYIHLVICPMCPEGHVHEQVRGYS